MIDLLQLLRVILPIVGILLVLLAVVTLLSSLGPVLLPIGILAAAGLVAWLWLAKGYILAADSQTYVTGSRKVTDIRPQLLNAVDDPGPLLKDNGFYIQRKHDGKRLLPFDRQGQPIHHPSHLGKSHRRTTGTLFPPRSPSGWH